MKTLSFEEAAKALYEADLLVITQHGNAHVAIADSLMRVEPHNPESDILVGSFVWGNMRFKHGEPVCWEGDCIYPAGYTDYGLTLFKIKAPDA